MSTADVRAPAAASVERGADERKREAAALYTAGHSQHEIARKFGVSQAAVWRWCRDLDAKPPVKRRPGPAGADMETKRAAAAMYADGHSSHACADHFGVGHSTLLRWLRELGVERRSRSSAMKLHGPAQSEKERAAELYRNGLSLDQVAAEVGRRCGTTVWAWLNELGVDRRPPRERIHAVPTERECEREGCAVRFVPDAYHVARGYGRFHSRRCGQLARWKRLTDIPRVVLEWLPARARQRWLGRFDGSKPPRPDAPPRGRPPASVSRQQRDEIVKYAARGWGRRAIANHLLVSERAVRNVLDELR